MQRTERPHDRYVLRRGKCRQDACDRSRCSITACVRRRLRRRLPRYPPAQRHRKETKGAVHAERMAKSCRCPALWWTVSFRRDSCRRFAKHCASTVEDEVRTMEVAQHMDEHTVRCIMLAPSEGLSRGMDGGGDWARHQCSRRRRRRLGRMFNVLGDPIDGGEALPASTEKWNIHRQGAVLCRAKPGREHSGNRHQGH